MDNIPGRSANPRTDSTNLAGRRSARTNRPAVHQTNQQRTWTRPPLSRSSSRSRPLSTTRRIMMRSQSSCCSMSHTVHSRRSPSCMHRPFLLLSLLPSLLLLSLLPPMPLPLPVAAKEVAGTAASAFCDGGGETTLFKLCSRLATSYRKRLRSRSAGTHAANSNWTIW